MIFIEVCVGSSCHLKGAPEIVEKLQKKIADGRLGDDIVLSGSFCTGRCNRVGVTVTVGDKVFTGITPDTFENFWNTEIAAALKADRENTADE